MLHLSLSRAEGFHSSHVRFSVESPSGEVAVLLDQPILLPPRAQSARTQRSARKLSTRYRGTPLLLFVSEYLRRRGPEDNNPWRALKETTESVHRYIPYRVPEDAPLGRYRVNLEWFHDGGVDGSSTARDDHFFVDDLEVVRVVKDGSRHQALVRNRSPEPVPVRLCEIRSRNAVEQTFFEVPPLSTSAISFRGDRAFLFLFEDREAILLSAVKSPLSRRNETLRWFADESGPVHVFVGASEAEPEVVTLTGEARRLWDQAASGTMRRCDMRDGRNARAYTSLVRSGLLVEEVPQEQPRKPPRNGSP
jgi:hypothetical protein